MTTASLSWTALTLLLLAVLALLHRPLGKLLRLVGRSSVALAFLAALSQMESVLGIHLGVNLFNALVLGILGIPGFGLLLLLQWVLR